MRQRNRKSSRDTVLVHQKVECIGTWWKGKGRPRAYVEERPLFPGKKSWHGDSCR